MSEDIAVKSSEHITEGPQYANVADSGEMGDSTAVQLSPEMIEKIEATPIGWAWSKSEGKLKRPDWLYILSDYLRRVADGSLKRLMIWAPPGYYKSHTISIWFPAFLFDRNPDAYVIDICNVQALALEFGRNTRDLVNEHSHYSTRLDSSAAGRWQIDGHKGGMYCAGIGTTITGRRSNFQIWDDPVKDWRDASSAESRNNKWEYYRSTARDRLEPGGAIIMAMQRWHVDDICGRILEESKTTGEAWTVLVFPAIKESEEYVNAFRNKYPHCTFVTDNRKEGEVLDPDRYSPEELDVMKGTLGYWWFAKFLQRPMNPQDMTVNPDWFVQVQELPRIIGACRYFDMAAKKVGKVKRGDYAAGVLTVKDIKMKYGIIDIRRERKTAGGIEDVMVKTILSDYELFKQIFRTYVEEDHKNDPAWLAKYDWKDQFEHDFLNWFVRNYQFWFESDTGGTGEIAASYLTRTLRERAGVNVIIRYEHPSGSKESRAEPMFAQAMAGNYWLWGSQAVGGYLTANTVWDISGFLARVALFGSDESDYDDEVDGSSGGFSKLLPARTYENKDFGLGWV